MGQDEITAAFETITPATALEYLRHNTRNRTVSEKAVSRIADDIVAENWIVNGDPIRFGSDDVLYDGQHRLLAIVRARIPVVALVVRGLPISARDMIDVAVRKRTARHVVEITDGVQIRGLKVAWMSAAEHILATGRITSGFVMSVAGLRAAMQRHGDAVDALAEVFVKSASFKRLASAAVVGSLIVAYRSQPDITLRFAETLHTGESKQTGDPAVTLRQYLAANFGRTLGSSGRDDLTLRTFDALEAYSFGSTRRITSPSPEARYRFISAWVDPRIGGTAAIPFNPNAAQRGVGEVGEALARYAVSVRALMADGMPRSADDIARECDIPTELAETVLTMVDGLYRASSGAWATRRVA